ncbi:uncharacterized protein PV09_03117 [Verruconis gallopava]|uniref:Zn(2)-C6 fungal-type domain-containing protein n=1 Tax=Verruconis gallopava TaxID=253628 RepID=A0A0D2B3W7_9PEZI|nr:uncharacterized protein PV09_03117 [Verruconis gallopava]KIW05924.1 hypothetical protein PV09_03117 [Verruconis gallopava]
MSPTEAVSPSNFGAPKAKRTRVALACLRCRSRKQKCDGAQETCSTCRRLGLQCQYKAHITPRPDQKRMYIQALEEHIAGLEQLLAESHDNVTVDHWKERRLKIRRDSYMLDDNEARSSQCLPATTTDPVWNAIINSGTDATVGRLFKSVIHHDLDCTKTFDQLVASARLAELAPPDMALKLIEGYVKHLSTQYPIIHSPWLRKLYSKPISSLNIFELCILHLVYANSGRILEAIGEPGDFHADQHYEAALQHVDFVLALRDIRSVQILLLLALYCLRGSRNPGAWTLAGLAVRQCIELGLHRKSSHDEITIEKELNARAFWSCYYLDRGVSVALGRPPAISDGDIDAEFPLDIDEHIDDIISIHQAAQNRSPLPARPPSTLTPFIHFLRLRMIESKIEHVIYRLNRKSPANPIVIQGFLDQLIAWKDAIPVEYYENVDSSGPHSDVDAFLIPYYKCVRLLLYSQLSKKELNMQYLRICADACAGLCGAYKRLNRARRADCSPLALQSLFLCGLTLLYCAWLAPAGYLDVMDAISDCNLMLYVMSERSSAAQKYRDIFERIKMNVLDVVERGNDQGSRDGGVLDAEMTERCRALDVGLIQTVRTDYEQIITDLAKDTDRIGLSEQQTPDSEIYNHQNAAFGLTTPPQWSMSPGPLLDYGVGHTFGTFIDAAFMFNLEDFGGFNGGISKPDAL